MRNLKIEELYNLDVPVLIRGETGCGKSYLAKKIFENSVLYQQKFLTAHLASLKEEVIESELFGHQKGAFTGAVENKNGYLYETGSGTLFLDEIGELSLESQKKLLYLLEEKKFTPIGSTKAYDFKGRILMATNANLEDLVAKKLFRSDLYFRINTFSLEVSALRENRENLDELLMKNLRICNLKYQKQTYFSTQAKEYLLNYSWPGNIRQLKHAVEFAVALSKNRELEVNDFHFLKTCGSLKKSHNLEEIESYPTNFNESFEVFEKAFLNHHLKLNQGRVTQTAKIIGMSKTGLIQKARKYGIDTYEMRYSEHLKSA